MAPIKPLVRAPVRTASTISRPGAPAVHARVLHPPTPQRLDFFHPGVGRGLGPVLKPLIPIHRPPAEQPITLTSKELKTLSEAKDGKLGAYAKKAYETLVASAGYKKLLPAVQKKVLKAFAEDPPTVPGGGLAGVVAGLLGGSSKLNTVVNNAEFQKLSARQQAQTLDVFMHTDSLGQSRLVDLLNRQIDGHSAMVDRDSTGATLIDRLGHLATGSIDQRFAANGITRESLLSTIMQEAATPGQINQSDHGTCTTTSMQYMLTTQNPAEYVRLMQGLVGPGGTVKLRNGETLTRVADSIANDSATGRSASERVFQAAMMDFSNGGKVYSNVTDKSSEKVLWWTNENAGLYGGEEARGMAALFGRNFSVYTGNFDFRDDREDRFDKLKSRLPRQTLSTLAWTDGNGKASSHAVVVEKIENGRVYFRNPWGPTSDPNGTTYNDPSRQLEDRNTRLESMSEADFKKALLEMIID